MSLLVVTMIALIAKSLYCLKSGKPLSFVIWAGSTAPLGFLSPLTFNFFSPNKLIDHSVNLSSDHKPSFLIELLGEFHAASSEFPAASSEFPLQTVLSNDSLNLNPTTVALKWCR